MIVLGWIVLVFLVLAVRAAFGVARRRRIARELQGDWWGRFEQELTDYSDRVVRAARDAEWRT